jgi:hypothetical protein
MLATTARVVKVIGQNQGYGLTPQLSALQEMGRSEENECLEAVKTAAIHPAG